MYVLQRRLRRAGGVAPHGEGVMLLIVVGQRNETEGGFSLHKRQHPRDKKRAGAPSVPLCEDRRTATLLDVTHPNTFLSEGPNTPV